MKIINSEITKIPSKRHNKNLWIQMQIQWIGKRYYLPWTGAVSWAVVLRPSTPWLGSERNNNILNDSKHIKITNSEIIKVNLGINNQSQWIRKKDYLLLIGAVSWAFKLGPSAPWLVSKISNDILNYSKHIKITNSEIMKIPTRRLNKNPGI